MRKDDIMELGAYFKSIIDQDRAAVVICSLDHKIIYMNPAAVLNYEKWGGDKLLGRSLLGCHNPKSGEKIQQVLSPSISRILSRFRHKTRVSTLPIPSNIPAFSGKVYNYH